MIEASAATTLELSIPADPALALTARMFAGAVARHLRDDGSADDLKLALSELLATAIDAGATQVVFRVDLERHEVSAEGTGAGVTAGGTIGEADRFARTHRADLLAALFPGIRTDGDTVTLPLHPPGE